MTTPTPLHQRKGSFIDTTDAGKIARLQQAGEFTKNAVGGDAGAAVEQACAAAFGGRVLGDEQLGQFEVEIAQDEGADRSGHGA